MAFALIVLKALMQIAALALFGQFIVGIFNWGGRHQNFVYQLLAVVSKPAVRLVRLISPRVILDQHVPAVAFMLMVVGSFAVGLWHRDVCMADLTQASCERWQQAWQGAQQ